MAEVFKLQASIGLETQKFFEGIKKAITAGGNLKSNIEGMATSVTKSQTEITTLKNKLEIAKDATKSASETVAKLCDEFNKSAKETGATSEQTKRLASELDKAEKELSDCEKQEKDLNEQMKKLRNGTDDAGKSAEKSSKKFEGFGNTLKSVTSTAGKVVSAIAKISTVAVGAAATGLTAITKQALDASASYEQLKGGVETLFGAGGMTLEEYANSVGKSVDDVRGHYNKLMTAQDKVMQNSYNAFQTAGMSSNAYMETVTSFSASLLQSVAGDTNIAADIADMAIRDMSDNANKMGTDMQSIQNAYQGFAKQNYTMLDNLKLGYGGTKQEMERLLADAEKLSGQKYSIESLMDVYNAIHMVQEEMGITGTTAKEAAGTIEGSVGSMKAAWENLITAFGSSDMPIGTFAQNFVDSISGAAKNVVPRIGQIVKSISMVFPDLVSDLFTSLKETIEKEDLGTTILDAIDTLVTNGADVLGSIMQSIFDGNALTDLLSRASDTVGTVAGAIWNVFKSAVELLPDKLPEIVDTVTGLFDGMFDTLTNDLPGVMEAVTNIITFLVEKFNENLPAMLETGLTLLETILKGIVDSLPKLIPAAIETVKTLGVFLAENAPELITTAIELITTIVDAIFDNTDELLVAAKEIITTLWDTMTNQENLQKMIDAGAVMLTSIFNGLSKFAGETLAFVGDLYNELKEKLDNLDWFELGKNILRGIIKGLENLDLGMLNGFKDAWITGLKDVFGIHSPSTVMRDLIGKNLALGIGEGFTQEIPDVGRDAMNAFANMQNEIATVSPSISYQSTANGAGILPAGGSWAELTALLNAILASIREGKSVVLDTEMVNRGLGTIQTNDERGVLA